ncbi:uncharacterized protein LOC132038160 [Lycium ferocissimum]|uniref:uncharacterized protein LOC132038160 n=1 Tax=Lycium ferocissimum TaxID=112874 RepID=UPI002814A03C|nr:uncharacterized protein LOC132038160 [Lycium ferocissimum]
MEEIKLEVVNFYKSQFTQEGDTNDFELLRVIPSLINHEQNMQLCSYPTKEEVKEAVFALSGDSASGPDGFTGVSYQQCWDIVGNDVHAVVLSFFYGAELPKSITHTNLVLIPKRHLIQTFSDMRPISLSNFINKATSFFQSTRGVKQGDPLSPTLFLLSAEVLSRASNSLFNDAGYIGYGMPKWSNALNQLAYADDIIIFAFAQPDSLQSIMRVLSRKRKEYYSDLIKRMKGRLHSWKGKLLSFGGKAVLIKSVLQTMPLHLLSVLAPPKCVLNELHKVFARYFWSNKEEGRSKHWVAWKDVCLPIQEKGLGFKSLFDVSKALFAKLWWRFRTTSTLWANYMWNKYYKKVIPNLVQWKGGTQVWKRMLEAREDMDHEIWWEIKGGSVNVCYQNWTKLGPLHWVVPNDFPINEGLEDVADLIEDGRWKEQLI